MKASFNIKSGINTSAFLGIFIAAFLLPSCSGNNSSNPAAEFSDNGVALSRFTINVYLDLNKTITDKKYEEGLVKILNDLSPETYIMKSEADYTRELENLYLINAFRNLERVFMAYNLQMDPNFSINQANLQQKIYSACSALDSIDINENIRFNNEHLKKNLNGNKFRVDEAIFQLTNLYSDLWIEESHKWFLMLESYQEALDVGIKKIPTSLFDIEKLRKIIDEPYSNGAVLANLYKLNMIKENQTTIANLENQVQIVSTAFGMLLQVQGELIKRKKDKIKVQELNTSLGVLLAN
ncbi:MAG: hypothetical protein P1P88_14290 [Bacteroidales bacterium]|nr:hypothetical protein [Bacteroidales bacterium]